MNLKLSYYPAVLAFFLLAFIACNNNENEEFGNIETVQELDDTISTCRNSEFDSREFIEINLIGEWKLIGIKSGWVNEFRIEDINLTIDTESITLNNNETGEILKTPWTLEFIEVNSYEYFYLETNESGFNNRLGMQTFCENYMYGTGRVDDGETYVYKKVN